MRPWRVPYGKFGKGPGLERCQRIAATLGVDLAAFGQQGAVIVGSNGKGSTAAMTAALLQQVSSPVGLFTSPHMLALNERFRIDGEDIGDDDLSRHWERVRAAANATGEHDSLGGFEFLFLIAADWFSARGCSHTIWEAGIGGRLDPVRLIEAQQLALTSLDFEHTELLGDTLVEIARDKIDAAPPGASLFASESCAPVRDAIRAHCAARSVNVLFIEGAVPAPLAGDFQRENAALALCLARHASSLRDEQAAAGFAATRWPGRLETLSESPLVVIDVGHTPAGVNAALRGFTTLRSDREAVLVCGVSHDKDVAAIVSALALAFPRIVCAAAHHKGAAAAEIARCAISSNPEAEVVIAENIADARRQALARASADGAIYVAGGLFLAAEFKAAHLGLDPASLVFF
jgi:dihydrofolate synthase/folylpolyglutamate synthase